jgi:hypothetical protein
MRPCPGILLLAVLSLPACAGREADAPAGEGGWLQGTTAGKFEVVAAQLRGFDLAMVETGYRYRELAAAGHAANWDYAAYQAAKIRTAIENGLVRRPKRAASAQTFLTIALPAVEDAVGKRDPALFEQRFGALTAACNSCHEAERVAFVRVAAPSPGHLGFAAIPQGEPGR